MIGSAIYNPFGGGTISGATTFTGNVTINGTLTVTGATVTVTDTTTGLLTVDITNAEALLVRKDADAGDVLRVDTTNNLLTVHAGADLITHALRTAAASECIFNEQGADIDFRIEADANANMIVLDASNFTGVGQLNIGSAAQATPNAFVVIDNPALTANSNVNFFKLFIDNSAAVTIATGTTSAIVSSFSLDEPNITLAGTGAVTDAYTLYISGAPTEGTRNGSLLVDAGVSRFDAQIIITDNAGTPLTVHDLNNATLVVFNEQGSDIDFRIESDTSANAITLDAGLLGGVGQLIFGAVAQASPTGFVLIENPAFTAVASTNIAKLNIENTNAITIPTGTTTVAASLFVGEPNLIATGGITNAVTVYIEAAPTEATNNYSLWIDSGVARFDGDVDLNNTGTLINVGAAGNDWTANALTMSNGASTSNMALTVQNTTNAGVSNSFVDIAVGGTSSTGDPQLRWTIPGGTSWMLGTDNDDGDFFKLVTGTSFASNRILEISGATSGAVSIGTFAVTSKNTTLNDAAGAFFQMLNVQGSTITLSGATTITTAWGIDNFERSTITQVGAHTVSTVATVRIEGDVNVGGSVTITNNYSLWVDGGVSRFDDDIVITDGAATPLDIIRLDSTAGGITVFNDQGADIDFRIEGDTVTNLFTLDAGLESIGIGQSSFDATGRRVLAISNGTEPAAGLTDAVQFYSIDNAAANTIPAFRCEGTDVLATGQADSASSVRVRMRINGTTVVLLAI